MEYDPVMVLRPLFKMMRTKKITVHYSRQEQKLLFSRNPFGKGYIRIPF